MTDAQALDIYRELTGSQNLGTYGVTLIDRLWDTLTDIEVAIGSSLAGFILNGSTVGGAKPTPNDADSLIRTQLLASPNTGEIARWAPTTKYAKDHWDGQYRTLRELVLQIAYLEAKIARPNDTSLDPRDAGQMTARPIGLTATVEQSTGKIFLQWDDVASADDYVIYETASPSGVPGGPVKKSESVRGPLGPGNYTYWVTARIGGKETVPSQKVVATVNPRPATGSTSALPDGTAAGTNIWRGDLGSALIRGGNYKKTDWNSEPHSLTWPPKVTDSSPIGRAIAFTLPNKTKRTEVEPDHKTFGGDGEAWFGLTFGVDDAFPLGTSSWQVIWQLHGNDTTSPRFALQLNRNKLSIGDNRPICSIEKNKRYDVVIKADFSRGLMSVWVNGVKVADGVSVGKSATPYYLKVGYYHDSSLPGGTIFQKNHALGTGYGAVDPHGR